VAEIPGAAPGPRAAPDPEATPDPEAPPGPDAIPGVVAATEGGRSPGWREVILVAVLVLAAVFAVEIASSLLPPLREAFRGFPVTITVLVVGTVGLLVLIAVRRPRR
jgi:hypothetical protein